MTRIVGGGDLVPWLNGGWPVANLGTHPSKYNPKKTFLYWEKRLAYSIARFKHKNLLCLAMYAIFHPRFSSSQGWFWWRHVAWAVSAGWDGNNRCIVTISHVWLWFLRVEFIPICCMPSGNETFFTGLLENPQFTSMILILPLKTLHISNYRVFQHISTVFPIAIVN